jgi:hypothetical protein
MRFWSIWRPGYPMALKEKIERTKDWAAMELERLLPKRAAYWVAMVQIGRATMTSQNVPATSLDNVLTNLGNVKDGKPLEQFKWHESMRFPEDDHSEHVHVAPLDLNNLTEDERAALPEVIRHFLEEREKTTVPEAQLPIPEGETSDH